MLKGTGKSKKINEDLRGQDEKDQRGEPDTWGLYDFPLKVSEVKCAFHLSTHVHFNILSSLTFLSCFVKKWALIRGGQGDTLSCGSICFFVVVY